MIISESNYNINLPRWLKLPTQLVVWLIVAILGRNAVLAWVEVFK